MMLSNKADYALHAMFHVAAANDKKLCTINNIAEEESIPREFLAKVLRELTIAGLLKSHKGIFGGYTLAKPRKDITILSIIEAIDGPLSISSCNWSEAQKKGFHRKGACAAASLLSELQGKITKDLSSMTLEKLNYSNYSVSLKDKAKGKI
jgi:Rrf2 family protein